jgi:hypothetical protein
MAPLGFAVAHCADIRIMFIYIQASKVRAARHAIHLQFDISANTLVIKAIRSPKWIVWCPVDCTNVEAIVMICDTLTAGIVKDDGITNVFQDEQLINLESWTKRFLSLDDSIHTYHSRFIPKEVAEASQIFLRDAHVLPKLLSYEGYCSRNRW